MTSRALIAKFPVGYEKLTGLSAAKALQSVPTQANFALIQVEGQAVRYRDDGTNPTVTDGMRAAVGAVLEYDGDLNGIKFIELAASATLHILYYTGKAS